MRNKYIELLGILFFAFLFSGYEHDTIDYDSELATNKYIHKLIKKDKWYLWYDKTPDIPFDSCHASKSYLKELIYRPYDKWSYIENRQKFYLGYSAGKYIGHGFGRKTDKNNNVYVSYVYKNSPFDKAGITRGYKILEINDITTRYISKNELWDSIYGKDSAGVINKFLLEDLNGCHHTLYLPKDTINEKTVLHSDIFQLENKNTGYFVYQSFLNKSVPDLDSLFTVFQQNNVTELIIDLRYNTGGELRVANHLANLIAGAVACNKVFGRIEFNDEKSAENSTFWFHELNNSLCIERVIFITSDITASASEYLINGLRPHVEVVLVGDNTYGKPVGARVFQYRNKVINIICFKVLNSLNEGEYFNGIPVNVQCDDDLQTQLGDTTECCLKEALFYSKHDCFSNDVKNINLTGKKYIVGN